MMEGSHDSNSNILTPELAVFTTKLPCGPKAAMMTKIKSLFLRHSRPGGKKDKCISTALRKIA